MKHFKKFLALLLSFCLLSGLLPGAMAADGRAGRTIDVSTEEAFKQALANAQDGDTIRLMASMVYRNMTSDDSPMLIKKNITIDGNGNSLILWWGGIVLGADAVLKNMSLSLPNSVYYSICANGYELTLDNVKQDVSAHEISVFCGSMERTGYTIPQSGPHGIIRIKGDTKVENLYAGSLFRRFEDLPPADQNNPPALQYQAPSSIMIESGASGKVGDIHVCGAAKVGNGRQTPTPDAQKYPYKGSPPEISLYGNVAGDVYGWDNRPDVTLNDGTGNLMSPTLYNANSISVGSGNFELAAGSYFPETAQMSISDGAKLSLSKLFDSVTVGDFIGGGTLILGRSQTLNVKGTISGTTSVAIGGIKFDGSSSEAPLPNRVYIRGAASAAENSFELLGSASSPNANFEFSNGEWSGPVVENIDPVLQSLSVQPEHTVTEDADIVIPIYPQYVENGASLQMMAMVDHSISVNDQECKYENGVYLIDLGNGSVVRLNETLDDDNITEILSISAYQAGGDPDNDWISMPVGEYAIKITVPADSSASGQPITETFTLKVVSKDNGPISIKVPEGKTLVYNGQEQIGVEAGSGYTLSKTTSATEIGDYTATATPESGYQWLDNTIDAKDISWSIKAPPTKQSPPSGLSTTPPESETGKGKIIGTTAGMEYAVSPISETSTWTPCTETGASADSAGYTEVAPGTYAVRYRADESNNLLASDTVEVTVEAYVAPEKPAAPTGLTAAAPETADGAGAIEGTDAEMEYAAKGNYTSAEDVPENEWIPCFGETTAVMPGTYYVRVKADPSKNRLTGDAAAITVPELGQTIPEAPEGLRGKAPETADGMGSLIGTTAEMEYAEKGDYTSAADVPADEWKDCTADATAAAPGTYYVRVKADPSKNQLAGEAAEVTIEPFENTPPLEAPSNLRGEAPENQNGKGKILGTTTEMEYVLSSVQNPTGWTACGAGETLVQPGTYLVRYKADPTMNRPASESTEVEVPEFGGEEPGTPPEGLTTEAPETQNGMGKILGTTTEMEYVLSSVQNPTDTQWTACGAGETLVLPGTYLVRYKADPKNNRPASESTEVEVPAFSGEEFPDTPGTPPEGLTTEAPETEGGKGKILGTTDKMEYSSDGETWTDCEDGETEVDPGQYYVRLKAVGDQPASAPATVYVPEYGKEPPTVQDAPEGLTTEAPATEDGKGKILGTTDKMEYSSDGIHWTDCSDGETEVEPGVYYVRLKGNLEENLAPGEPLQVTVHTYASTLYPVMVIGSGAAENGTGNYRPGDTVKIDAGTREGSTFAGWTGDVEFENAASVQTTFIMPEEAVTVTANWKEGEGTTPPEPSKPSRPSGGNSHPTRPSGSRPSSGSSKPETTQKPSKPETPEEPEPQEPAAPQPGSNPAEGWDNPYRDVDSSEWYYTAVAYTTRQGLMSGTGSGSFSPAAVMTRGQLVTILYRLAGSPTVDGSLRFPDTSSTAFYADAVRWATQNGITGGYSNGLFGPEDPVTNEQLCAFFHRYAKLAGIAGTAQPGVLSGFADWQQISDYAQDSFGWAVDAGILFGDSQRRLAPQSEATRAQTAAIVMRFCQSVI